MASVEIRHSRRCALEGKRTRDLDGCSGRPLCSPSYTVLVHRPEGGFDRHRAGKNRREAELLASKLSVNVAEGAYQTVRNIGFAEWAEKWRGGLQIKQNTIDSYLSTMSYAIEAFGSRKVRSIRTQDIVAFNALLQEKGLSASTRRKHQRVLNGCFASAVSHGYAASNPVKALPASERPRSKRREAAYFTNEEVPQLFSEIPGGFYRPIFLLALKTGMRQSEIIALQWGDVDLVGSLLRVRRGYTSGYLTTPKNHEARSVDLTASVVDVLARLKNESGDPPDGQLIFPGAGSSGYLASATLCRGILYPAMRRAGIPREGPTGELRTFHSLRHTFAKRALENGARISWLSRHLGHSSIQITLDVYGHFEAAERQEQAKRLEGVFGV